MIVGRQVEGLAKDVIWKVAATKEAPVKAAFGSMAQCQTGLVSADSDHPFQSCNIVISDTSNLNSAGVPEVGPYSWKISFGPTSLFFVVDEVEAITCGIYQLSFKI